MSIISVQIAKLSLLPAQKYQKLNKINSSQWSPFGAKHLTNDPEVLLDQLLPVLERNFFSKDFIAGSLNVSVPHTEINCNTNHIPMWDEYWRSGYQSGRSRLGPTAEIQGTDQILAALEGGKKNWCFSKYQPNFRIKASRLNWKWSQICELSTHHEQHGVVNHVPWPETADAFSGKAREIYEILLTQWNWSNLGTLLNVQ